jgi:hypothetical protein
VAFRIADSVVRGEIDNRVMGVVRGTIWLEGRVEPVVLELAGNAHPDLAGCRLTFTNPQKRVPHPELPALARLQRGGIGDLTASRKVRVPAVPIDEFLSWPKEKGRPPSRWANCLYLEWYSEANGRVVIESTDFEVSISEPEWRLTPEEEAAEQQEWIEEMNAACEEALNEPEPEPDPAREGIDWIRTDSGDLRHPLQHRCSESAIRFWRLASELGLDRIDDSDPDLDQFLFEFQITGAKLAGALAGHAEGREHRDAAFTIACLKRALGHLHKSQVGLEAVTPKQLLPDATIAEARQELFEIREGILDLMGELRRGG